MADFAYINQLESSLSPSHVQQLRSQVDNYDDYQELLEAEYQASNEAIAQLSTDSDLDPEIQEFLQDLGDEFQAEMQRLEDEPLDISFID